MGQNKHINGLIIMLLAFMVSSCARSEVVVYADPWLAGYSSFLEQEFERRHPDIDMKVKELSSEVIAQHLHFGQPVDVVLCMGFPQMRADFREKALRKIDLANSRVLKVHAAKAETISKEFKTESCMMVEASLRPMRMFAEQAFGKEIEEENCLIIADFVAQAKDYLLRGWVPEGMVPWHFWSQHQDQLAIQAQGPLILNAFSAVMMEEGKNPGPASLLMDLISSEESKKKLVELGHLL